MKVILLRTKWVMGEDYDGEKEAEELRKLNLMKSDVEYLAQFAVGGPLRRLYKRNGLQHSTKQNERLEIYWRTARRGKLAEMKNFAA